MTTPLAAQASVGGASSVGQLNSAHMLPGLICSEPPVTSNVQGVALGEVSEPVSAV